MSSITKTAVYDARLLQDPPAYAVQKGALSVSVAPFNAIAATASSMVFQVMVPSLNVFVDRKIQLRTTLNFSANLFYSGPRSVTSYTYTVLTGTITAVGYKLTFATSTGVAAAVPGSYFSWGGSAAMHGFKAMIIGQDDASNFYVDEAVWAVAGSSAAGMILAQPSVFGAPDPVMGVRFDLSNDQFTNGAQMTSAFQPLGYATAVSAKDLSYCMFPVQSCISSMTATLNDCTVTTNGDTLHEQIMLTNTKENVKQRTTPCNTDVYCWGYDDANNGSGNFSSYSVTNSLGDLPTGSFPTTWYPDATATSPLQTLAAYSTVNPQAGITAGVTAGAAYPFFAAGAFACFSTGIGWYVAKASSRVPGVNLLNGGLVVVPFVEGQPVWTTAFPQGDLLCVGNNGITASATAINQPGFDIKSLAAVGTQPAGEYLTLLTNVPPYSMIGARIYNSATASPAGTEAVAIGFVNGIVSGVLGQVGSMYTFATATAGGLAAIKNSANLALQGGFQVTSYSMPVYGAVSVIEPLVISPLIFADAAEYQSVGLYGMTNMQFVLNFTGKLGTTLAIATGVLRGSNAMSSEPYWCDDLTQVSTNTGNILRSSGIRTTISDLEFLNLGSTSITGPWLNPTLLVTFLTPGPDVTLPLVSTVPYVELPRYVLQQTVATGQIGNGQLATNTISLTSIPDMIMLYVKPATKGPSQLDCYVPIKNVSITFDNFSNLLSGFQQVHLYEATVAAGLDIDFQQFRGFTQGACSSYARVTGQTAFVAKETSGVVFNPKGVTQLSGSPLLLRMGHDITLSPGLAPGCLGNYSIQANITVDNQYGFFDYVNTCTITLIAINTGFFETVRGQSAIRKTVLNSADVEAAIPEAGVTRSQLTRMVGRGNNMMGSSTIPAVAHSIAKAIMSTAGGGGGFGGNVGKAMDMGMAAMDPGKRARTTSGLRV